MKLVDVHAHLEHSKFDRDLDEVVGRFVEAGGEIVISSGVSPETNRKALELAKKHEVVRVSFGLYPLRIENSQSGKLEVGSRKSGTWEDNVVDAELKWIKGHLDSCVAIGEIGLDFSLEKSSSGELVVGSWEKIKERQKDLFRKMLAFARKVDLPVVIHSRKAEADVIEILEGFGMKKVIMHCFCGRKNLIKRCVENGWYFSVPPAIMRWNNFKMLVENVPIGQLLTETDSPYLSSVVGERNEPVNVLVTLREIARIKSLSVEKVASEVFENFERVFGV